MTATPVRTCIGCRERRPKLALVRLVRDADGVVTVDTRHRAPGRGAYVCATTECVERAVKGGRLTHALRKPCRVAPDVTIAVLQRDSASTALSSGNRADRGSRDEQERSPDPARR